MAELVAAGAPGGCSGCYTDIGTGIRYDTYLIRRYTFFPKKH
jgi:hypothetical protein